MKAVSAAKKGLDGPLTAVLGVLPTHLRQMILQLPPDIFTAIEEIRVRHGRPLILGLNHKDAFLHRQGGLADRPSQAYVVSDDDLRRTTQLISNSSIYALEEELKNGYITLAGGHRVGITGKVVTEKGGVKTMKYISGINIRVSRQVLGAADGVIKHLLSPKGMVYHTMLISPPRCGKTTLLRDIVRQLSNGIPSLGFGGINVGVVDERSEIAGCYQGVPQLDVGIRTDVLDACPKAAGMMMLLRSMSPGLIATDEIGRSEDVAAVEEVLNAGIKVLTTAHGSSIEELKRRPALSRLLSLGLIERYVILGRSRGVGTVEQVIDGISRRTLEGLRGVKRC